MTARNSFTLAATAAVFTVFFVASALALDNGNTVRPAAPMKMEPTKLSENECKGLGGKIIEVTDCKGLGACITTDKDGVIHKACLTKQ